MFSITKKSAFTQISVAFMLLYNFLFNNINHNLKYQNETYTQNNYEQFN